MQGKGVVDGAFMRSNNVFMNAIEIRNREGPALF